MYPYVRLSWYTILGKIGWVNLWLNDGKNAKGKGVEGKILVIVD